MTKPTIILYREHVDSFSNELSLQGINFDMTVYPITNDNNEEIVNQSIVKEMPLKSSEKWNAKVIFRLSDLTGLNWNVEEARQVAEKKLLEEIAYARALCKQKRYYLYRLPRGKCANLSRIFTQKHLFDDIFLLETSMTSWQTWNQVRGHADYASSMRLALVLGKEVPTEEEVRRWLGEPVHCLIIPIDLFFINVEPHAYPELHEQHQKLLYRFIKRGVTTVMLKVVDRHYPIRFQYYHESLYFYMTTGLYGIRKSMIYLDKLQIPLQPLHENLDSGTYEIFEKDPSKYAIYQAAIESALLDVIPETLILHRTAVLMIVGAGRGPLVRASINAGAKTKRKVKIYIVEKNPNAIGKSKILIF